MESIPLVIARTELAAGGWSAIRKAFPKLTFPKPSGFGKAGMPDASAEESIVLAVSARNVFGKRR
jgi:hypothetical protein